MKIRHICLFICVLMLVSCNEESEKRELLRLKSQEKTEAVFKIINDNWNLHQPTHSSQVSLMLVDWKEWRDFTTALKQKPKSTIGAFRKQSKLLADLSMKMNYNMPEMYNNSQFKSRISVLTTQLQSLDLYLNLQDIPTNKVLEIIKDVNSGMISLQNQMEQMLVKASIPKEEGESEMIKLLDTTRAIKMNSIK